MSTRIGCALFVYAKMTTEDTATTTPVYADPVGAPGVISININPNAASETLFADDGPYDVATTLGKVEVEINKAELKTSEKADLLGHTIDAKGGIIYGDSDVPPLALEHLSQTVCTDLYGCIKVSSLTLRTIMKLRVIQLTSRQTLSRDSSLSLITRPL